MERNTQNVGESAPSKASSRHSEEGVDANELSRNPEMNLQRWMLFEGPGLDYDDEEDYTQPTIWWFTSTAFPLMAGTFGPIANLFSVCALLRPWRNSIANDTAHVPDPPWLIALNAISLFTAVSANFLLLANFAHRMSYRIAQPATIVLWYISSVFLFTPLGILDARYRIPVEQALSQSWWYGLISACLYFTISTLLLFNVAGAHFAKAYPASFATLTVAERTLMLETIAFSLYLALVAGVFSALEGWDFADALYWADYTFLTIGLGSDFPVTTTAGRMVMIPFSAFGILLVGLVVQSVRGLVLQRGKQKVGKRRLGRQREEWAEYLERRRAARNNDHPSSPSHWRALRLLFKRSGGAPDGKLFMNGVRYEPWEKEEFELMRYIESSAERVERYTVLGFSLFAFLFVWIGGSLIFWSSEHRHQGWTYPISLYFAYVSITTIGYGDFFPTSAAGRPFFVVWSVIAVPTVTVLISSMGDTIVGLVRTATLWVGRHIILPDAHTHHLHGPGRTGAPRLDSFDDRMQNRKKRRWLKLRAWHLGKGSGPRRATPHDLRTGGHPAIHAVAAHPLDQSATVRFNEAHSSQANLQHRADSFVPSHSPNTNPPPTANAARNPCGDRRDLDNHPKEGSDESEPKLWMRAEEEKRVSAARLAARLSREMVILCQDLGKQPDVQYTWEQWTRWLKLLEEPCPVILHEPHQSTSSTGRQKHRPPNPAGSVEEMGAPPTVRVATEGAGPVPLSLRSYFPTLTNIPSAFRRVSSHLPDEHSQSLSDLRPRLGRHSPPRDTSTQWTWLSDHGPLFSHENETEWLIGRLAIRLEEVLELNIRQSEEIVERLEVDGRRVLPPVRQVYR